MQKISLPAILSATLVLGLGMSTLADAPAPGAIRVVPCDQPVQSIKRGVCVNKMSPQDFLALSPGVSWWYNWHFTPTMDVPQDARMEFLPMVWGGNDKAVDGLKAYLKDHKPRRVLALNEPNLKGQAFITPQETAEWYKKIKAVADEYNIPVVGPNMSLGSATNDSITALDPIEKKEVTYTYMVPFLKAFQSYMGDTGVHAVAAHSYGNFGELNWMTGMMRDDFKRPVWVTEFAQWGAKDVADEQNYMIQSVDLFERTPEVEGYAWFKERADNAKISLLDKESGKLTTLGETYVNMPVHDPSVYYRLPGRLQAESYLKMDKSNIALTPDSDGFLEMQTEKGGVLDYNVAVPTAGEYSLKIRCKTQEGTKFEVLSGDAVIATATTSAAGWQTLETSAKLPAGNQTLRVRLSAYARFNWIEFNKK
jgi:hypothetical protein